MTLQGSASVTFPAHLFLSSASSHILRNVSAVVYTLPYLTHPALPIALPAPTSFHSFCKLLLQWLLGVLGMYIPELFFIFEGQIQGKGPTSLKAHKSPRVYKDLASL